MGIQQFRFFDKKGYSIRPKYNSDNYYEFNLSFDRVSAGLFEVQQFHILEEIAATLAPNEITSRTPLPKNNTYNLLINVLQFLKNKGQSTIEDLKSANIFNRVVIGEDNVETYCNQNNAYIDKFYDDVSRDTYYKINYQGNLYLTEYTENLSLRQGESSNLLKKLVRPLSNYNPDNDELTYFYFRWKTDDNIINKGKIFPFLVDQKDVAYYIRDGKKRTCFDTKKPYLNFVPLDDEYLEIDDDLNPAWRSIFPIFDFQSTTNTNTLNPDTDMRKFPIGEQFNQEPITLNFAINSDNEGVFKRTLEMFVMKKSLKDDESYSHVPYKFAELHFQGEVVGEHEGLNTILENFGRNIDVEDMYVCSEMDIDEDNPDWIKINQKRKELILLSNEIYRHFGSYKSFEAALDWLGYTDIRLREYFYNIKKTNPQQNKIYYSTVDIPDEIKYNENREYNEIKYGRIIKDPEWRKTSRFGLIYDLNRWSGEYDNDGFPIFETSFDYTLEEISIKLYGLREFLQKYLAAHHVRIMDITAEGIYFGKFDTVVWANQTPIIRLDLDNKLDFTAYPTVGKLKNLRKLLNQYIVNLDEEYSFSKKLVDLIAENKKLGDFKEKLLGDFSDNLQLSFAYQDELPFDTIFDVIDNYDQMRSLIIDCLVNTDVCHHRDSNTYLNWGPANPTSSKLIGQIVRLDISSYLTTYDDAGVTFDETQPWVVQDGLNEIETNSILSGVRESGINVGEGADNLKEGNDSVVIEHREEMYQNDVQNLKYPNYYSYDNLEVGKRHYQELTWLIKHLDPDIDFCYKVSGSFDDLKSILIILPYVGYYNVKLTAYDINNFPKIVYKEKYLEVIKPIDDIIAFGSFIREIPTFSDDSTTISNIDATFDSGGFCPLKSTLNDMTISYDDLNYINHANQDYAYLGMKKVEINRMEDDKIYLSSKSFYNDWNQYKDSNYRDVAVLARDSEQVRRIEFAPLKSKLNRQIEIQTDYTPKVGELISIYEDYHYQASEFTILKDENCIALKNRLTVDYAGFPENLRIGMGIILYAENYSREKRFVIADMEKDYINNIVKIWINDDESLNFNPLEDTDRFGNEYNDSAWKILRIKDKIVETRIKTVSRSGNLILDLEPKYHLKQLTSKKIEDDRYKVDFNLHSGWNVIELSKKLNDGNIVEYVEYDSENDETSIQINQPSLLEIIDTKWNVVWNTFDLDWALNSTRVDYLSFDKIGNIRLDELFHQTYDMMNFRNDTILGFRITDLNGLTPAILDGNETIYFNSGKIIIEDYEYEIILERFPREDYSSLSEDEVSPIEYEWKLERVIEFLNEVSEGPLTNFKFYQNDNIIYGIGRTYGTNTLFKIDYEAIQGDNSTYPMTMWSDYEHYYFEGPNNQARWNRFSMNYDEFLGWSDDISTSDRFIEVASGSFNMNNTFIETKPFSIPAGTTVFFNYYNSEIDDRVKELVYLENIMQLENNKEVEYQWIIIDEIGKKTLIKSSCRNINWLFKDRGSYSVELTVISNSHTHKIDKKSFVKVY